MRKSIVFLLALMMSVNVMRAVPVFCEEETALPEEKDWIILDDCVDLSVAHAHSDAILPTVTEEQNRYAFEDDFTMFNRQTSTAEWVEYEIPNGQYIIVKTYFRQNEEISHFQFHISEDGENWEEVSPIIDAKTVESWKWIPITYTIKPTRRTACFIRITFGNVGGAEWSPSIAGVYTKYYDDGIPGFIDCVGTPYEYAAELLKNLRLIHGYNTYEYRPYEQITRAEFSKMISSVLEASDTTGDSIQIFTDVSKEHWAAAPIAFLYSLGIIHGSDNNLFYPDDTITFQEAAKILSAALGYTYVAEDAGGYPSGFWLVAQRLGLLDHISILEESQFLNRGDAAQMLANALEVEVIYQTEFGAEERYHKDGVTFLEQYHQIEKVSGVVTDVGAASIIKGSHMESGQIGIDSKTYQSSFPMDSLLGQYVEAYIQYRKETGKFELLYAAGLYNTITDIDADQLLGIQDNKIVYEYDNGKEMRKSYDANTRVIYNGRYDTRMGIVDELSITDGRIRLIQNQGSGIIDTILIQEYNTYVMTAASKLRGTLSDRHRGAVTLNTEMADEIRVTRNGETIPYSEKLTVQPEDVIQVAQSRDHTILEIIITTDTETGLLAYRDLAEKKYKINDTLYHLSPYFLDYEGQDDGLGSQVTVLLDSNKRIVAIQPTSVENYGFLQSSAIYDAFSNTVMLRVITSTGIIQEMMVNSKTKINGVKNQVADVAGLTPQLVRYCTGENGTITELFTAANLNTSCGQDKFTMNYSSASCKYYGDQMKLFASVYQLNTATKIFIVPKDASDLRAYEVVDCNRLRNDTAYHVELFDVSRDYMVSAAVIYEQGSDARNLDSQDPVGIIEDTSMILDQQGNACLKVYAKVGEQSVEIYFDNQGGEDQTDSWLPNYTARDTSNGNNPFSRGEVIQYYMDSFSHCKAFRMLLTAPVVQQEMYYEKNTGDYGALTQENYFSELYSMYGIVTNQFPGKILCTTDKEDLTDQKIRRTFSLSGAVIYRFDRASGIIFPADTFDITPGTQVFVRMSYTAVREILIFS